MDCANVMQNMPFQILIQLENNLGIKYFLIISPLQISVTLKMKINEGMNK